MSVITESSSRLAELGGLKIVGSSPSSSVGTSNSSSRVLPLRDGFGKKKEGDTQELHYALGYKTIPKPSITLRRYESAPMAQQQQQQQHAPGKRRSIFGRELGTPPASPTQRKRSTSISTIPSSPSPMGGNSTNNNKSTPSSNRSLLAMLSRPIHETRLEERPHFCDITALPEDVLDQLPPDLPTPLRRFFDGNRSNYLEGMYPLSQPSPILRRAVSSSNDSSSEEEAGSAAGDTSSDSSNLGNLPDVPPPLSLNLTQSLRYVASSARKRLGSSSDETSSSSLHLGRKIRFDPRVTVTEFEDDPEYRQWYEDFELERFKKETIALAQQYLVKNPTILEDYCKPYLDPVTGTFRKKALFSILVLKATRSDDSLDEVESQNSSKRYEEMRQELADKQFKRILLVNHNKLVNDLFERSFVKLFPKAQFCRVDDADEALQLICKAKESGTYDLILAEDRFSRPWKSCEGLDNAAAAQGQEGNTGLPADVFKSASMNRLSKKFGNGALNVSDLFRMTRGMERVEKRDTAMLIAVSTHPEVTHPNLQQSGADAVWGLPPPLMSDELRDELVARLIQKRRKSAEEASSKI